MKGVSTVTFDGDWVAKRFDLNSPLGVNGFAAEREALTLLAGSGVTPEVRKITHDTIVMRRHTPLREWLPGRSPQEVVGLAKRLYQRVVRMYELGVNHRDFHVDNVVVSDTGDPMLIDFELSTSDLGACSYDLYGPTASGVAPHHMHERTTYHLWWDCDHPRSIKRRLQVPMEVAQGLVTAETHLVIVWAGAAEHRDRILEDLAGPFTIRDVVDRTWPDHEANLSRFYGVNLRGGGGKGEGQFRAIVVTDPYPEYEERRTSRGVKTVNARVFDRKMRYRKWAGGGHKVHATNTVDEARHDLALLHGTTPESYVTEWDGAIRLDERPLLGANGWDDIHQLLFVMNQCLNYVVLRNFEGFPEDVTLKGHGDVDLLVSNLKRARHILNSTPAFPGQEHRVHDRVVVGGRKIPFDLRHLGDDYYPKQWQRRILKHRVMERGLFWRPNDEHYFYSLLYHALVHKKAMRADYISRLTELAPKVGVSFSESEAIPLLRTWMRQHQYVPTRPEPSVGFNRENVTALQ